MIHPSPAIIVRSDTTIAECVAKMSEQNVGSVLVVRADYRSDLIGIFTERDLVQKLTLIRRGNHWDKSIAWIMTKPVMTLETRHLKNAPKIMLEKGIRHLPIVDIDDYGVKHLTGMISMRDLFRQLVSEAEAYSLTETTWNLKASTHRSVGLITGDDALFKLVRGTSQLRGSVELRRIESSSTIAADADLQPLSDLDFLLVDIDHGPIRGWLKLFSRLASKSGRPRVFIICDPALHTKHTVAALQKLAEMKKFALFTKPVDVLSLQQSWD
jgi:CBS domain-containing protein